MVAAVAVGAFAAAGAGQAASMDRSNAESDSSPASGGDASAALGVGSGGSGGATAGLPDLVMSKRNTSATDEVRKLTESQQVISKQAQERAEAKRRAEAARQEALRPKYVKPADGTYTSGFGGRWGTTHYGIDLANSLGTPIVAAADGVIIEAGPASGFGNWVREQLSDGTILVYGHMESYNVSAGDHVKAGDQIAKIGAEGQATGPHLHFEVWDPSGQKIDPAPWLAEHGVSVN
jgi:murein DD-endopeptidase MepM/ murein hydrolase activator NlpD